MAIWAFSLATTELCPRSLTSNYIFWYSEFDWSTGLSSCADHPVLYPQKTWSCRQSKNCFGENQLSPSSISFSLLTPDHLKMLHDLLVRTSSWCLVRAHPVQGKLAWLRVLHKRHCLLRDGRAINTRFPYGSPVSTGLACHLHKVVGSFFNRHHVTHIYFAHKKQPLVVNCVRNTF